MGGVNGSDLAGGLAGAVTRLREHAEVCESQKTGDGWMETPAGRARELAADLRTVLAAVPAATPPAPVCEAEPSLYERLAAIQHDIWSHWMRYLIGSKTFAITSEPTGRGMRTADVEHWRRQAHTPYADLTEREKASDREQVDRYWHLIAPAPAGPQAGGAGEHAAIRGERPFREQTAGEAGLTDGTRSDGDAARSAPGGDT